MHLTKGSRAATERDRRLLRYTALTAGCAALLGVLTGLVKSAWRPLAALDQGWIDHTHDYALGHTAWTAATQTLSDIGGTITMRVLLGVAALWLWLIGARVLAAWTAAQALIGWAVLWGLKIPIARARPHFSDPVSHADGPAFPSGHAMAATTTCAALVWLFWPRANRLGRSLACAVAVLAVLMVSWTRIALGVHWPSDVVGGWLAAGVVFGVITIAVELWRPGALARDVRRVDWRTRPRVQRVLVGGARPTDEPGLPGKPGHPEDGGADSDEQGGHPEFTGQRPAIPLRAVGELGAPRGLPGPRERPDATAG
ncbi:phosphatase PAP2 family protein [Kitasatospora sp. NPDC050543]|uniref:phosphatase PAP2 family protein n=1 Tax=Kitasatospora sp. NPDC050543 TaxID=3364054 RepID=UPI0037A322F1